MKMNYPYSGLFNSQSQQPMFPQPNGNVYLINNSLEVANIPTGAGITLALCSSENLLYLKSMQNGQPSFLAYKLEPYNESPRPQSVPSLEQRVAALEAQLQKIGGKLNEQPTTDEQF